MAELHDNINCIAEFLARRDVPELSHESLGDQVDIIVLLGNSLIGSVYAAANAIKLGAASQLLISGGVGHSTHDLWVSIKSYPELADISVRGRAEADIMADVLTQKLGLDESLIHIENTSTNCGTNAEQSRLVIDEMNEPIKGMALIQDPTMQRRSHACFERAFNDTKDIDILSFAPFVPRLIETDEGIKVDGSQYPVWPVERFISLVLGEVPRLRDDENGYGPRGRNFFDHIEIPDEVLSAYEYINHNHPGLIRKIPS